MGKTTDPKGTPGGKPKPGVKTRRGDPVKAIALIQEWIDEGDQKEDRETGELLARLIDEDRPSSRKLFPKELKGITW